MSDKVRYVENLEYFRELMGEARDIELDIQYTQQRIDSHENKIIIWKGKCLSFHGEHLIKKCIGSHKERQTKIDIDTQVIIINMWKCEENFL